MGFNPACYYCDANLENHIPEVTLDSRLRGNDFNKQPEFLIIKV